MDHFLLIFIVVTALGVFAFWKGIKSFLSFLKKFKPHVDSSKTYLDDDKGSVLPSAFDQIIKSLEKQRIISFNKIKGLFKRSFLKTWFVLAFLFFVLAALIGEQTEEVDSAMIIGPLMISFFLSLTGSGIYALVRKGQIKSKFSKLIKKELVAKVVKHVNPNLNFTETGIDESVFQAADLFLGKTFRSEDSIHGTVEGQKVTVSECHIETTVKTGKDSSMTYVYFNGMFVQLDLQMNLSSSLKIIPRINVENERKHEQFSFSNLKGMFKNLENPSNNQSYGTLKIHNANKKVATPIFEGEKYSVFGLTEVEKNLTPNFHKVIDFILAKFEYRDVFISINNGHFYLAISWNQNMFDSDSIMKESLLESGLVDKIHQDLLFINQIIKEVSLMNKIKE